MREAVDIGWRLAALALAWMAGVALQLQQRELWPIGAYASAIAVGCAAQAAAWRWRWRRAFAAGCVGVALLAMGATGWRASARLAEVLSPALEGADLDVTGVIASLPQRSPSGLRFGFEVEAAALRGQPVRLPGRLALGWYRGQHADAALSVAPPGGRRDELRAGQRWQFTLRLRRPHGNLNPHGFDYELYLFEQGLGASGYVRDAPPPRLLQPAAGYPVERLRQRVRDAIEANVPDRRAAGLLTALAIGDQGAIERDDWDLYRNTGIAHLVSISGLHITMFAWLAGTVIAALWRRGAVMPLRLPTVWAARWGGAACAAAYAVLSGWGLPAQRTVWMLVTVTLLQTLGLRWPWTLVLLWAAVVVTAADPWALLQPGFWLSFAAVGLLMASSSGAAAGGGRSASAPRLGSIVRVDAGAGAGAGAGVDAGQDAGGDAGAGRVPGTAKPPGWLGRLRSARGTGAAAMGTALSAGLRTQLIATVGLTPLTLIFFQQVSIVGFAANLFAIPLITLVIAPLALLGIVIVPLWGVAAWVVQPLNAALGALAQVPGAVWAVPVAPLWAQLAGLLGAVLLVLPLPWRLRTLALPLLLGLLLPPRQLPGAGDFELLAADVGQGSAVLVRTRTHLLVFDAGPQYSSESDAGQRVLVPLLRALGEPRIDRLVLSHRDNDHVGGAAALLKALPVDDVLSSLEPDHPLLAAGAPATRCLAGQSWVWDGVRFDVLWPAPDRYLPPDTPDAHRSNDPNDAASDEKSGAPKNGGPRDDRKKDRAASEPQSKTAAQANPPLPEVKPKARMKSNALSCVLRVSGQGADGRSRSALLTGDIERAQETALLTMLPPQALHSDVLIAPHHGSRTSSSEAFLDAVAPRVAVFQAGYRNRFGHPAPDVVQRYTSRAIGVRTSPACGAWRWGANMSPDGTCERDVARRYWHAAVTEPSDPSDPSSRP